MFGSLHLDLQCTHSKRHSCLIHVSSLAVNERFKANQCDVNVMCMSNTI